MIFWLYRVCLLIAIRRPHCHLFVLLSTVSVWFDNGILKTRCEIGPFVRNIHLIEKINFSNPRKNFATFGYSNSWYVNSLNLRRKWVIFTYLSLGVLVFWTLMCLAPLLQSKCLLLLLRMIRACSCWNLMLDHKRWEMLCCILKFPQTLIWWCTVSQHVWTYRWG